MNHYVNIGIKYLAGAVGYGNSNQAAFTTSLGISGSIIAYAFGSWNGYLELLVISMIMDYATGCAASIFEKKGLNSSIGFWGFFKKVLSLAAIFFGHRADMTFGTNFIMVGILTPFLVNEIISLGENYGRLGLPLSQYLVPIISILKPKGAAVNAIEKPE